MSPLYQHSKVRVLVVDDSPVVRELLSHILSAEPTLQVVATAANGADALEAVHAHRPDIVTMDVNMPRMDGLEATRRIMQTRAVPIVIVTGHSGHREQAAVFGLMEAGALAVIAKPNGPGHPAHDAAARELVQTVKAMAEVKVVRRWAQRPPPPAPAAISAIDAAGAADARLVAIGASTGGPLALKTILAGLPADFPLPLLVVQHIASGFADGLADWLRRATGFHVRIARDGDQLRAGAAYIAPDGMQMGLSDEDTIALLPEPPVNGHRPSVSHLFRSVAETLGPRAVGVLLTGMGKDGAEELGLMRSRGALTIAQDAQSSVVHGMPREAVALNAATHVLPPPEIAALLASIAANHRRKT